MRNFIDGLLVQTADEDGEVQLAVKLTFGDTSAWYNGGKRTDNGGIVIAENGVTTRFAFDAKGLERFRALTEADDDKARRVIIGRGTVGDIKVVGFPARGGRVSLKAANALDSEKNVPLY